MSQFFQVSQGLPSRSGARRGRFCIKATVSLFGLGRIRWCPGRLFRSEWVCCVRWWARGWLDQGARTQARVPTGWAWTPKVEEGMRCR
jgi:hypothetical protein